MCLKVSVGQCFKKQNKSKKVVMMSLLLMTGSVQAAATLDYAKSEAERLFARANMRVEVACSEKPIALFISINGVRAPKIPSLDAVKFDGYTTAAQKGSFSIAAREEKGVLNGLYALAERLGFSFVLPGEAGERVPASLTAIQDGTWTENPRFCHRGIFMASACDIYSAREWYAFLAKLRFNSMCAHASGETIADDEFARLVGLRLEVGGHGMSACLPRELFDKEPELFRMFQPEDFSGKRMKDSNFCATNPKTREIVKENFKKKLIIAQRQGYYAVHGWADDLPGGGWCMCSRCRALLGTDQSQLTMNLEAQAVRELGANLRVPAIAYHDTMFPSQTIAPDPLCFMLFAPRERCYAHALNDASCALNRHYFAALQAWVKRYTGIDDAHTFEYYNDKLLFRGHTPYLPAVILGDANAYEQAGISCWMSLQVGGQPLAPDWNMLVHSMVAWENQFDVKEITRRIVQKVATDEDKSAWTAYLTDRARAYASAWKVCDIPSALYFDYRFMPERPTNCGGANLEAGQQQGAEILSRANQMFAQASAQMKGFSARMAQAELKRSTFEEEDLRAMTLQQKGLDAIADCWNGAGKENATKAIENLNAAIVHLKKASQLLEECAKGFEGNQYYFNFVKNWTVPEIENKIRIYLPLAK